MKKSKLARKCSQRSGLTIAQLVNAHKSFYPQKVEIKLEDGKSELLTFKSLNRIQFKALDISKIEGLKFLPANTHLLEIREMTQSKMKQLRRMGFTVQVIDATEGSNKTYSIIRAMKRDVGFVTKNKRARVDSVVHRRGLTRGFFSPYCAHISRDGSGGLGGGGIGGGHFHLGGGGGGNYSRNRESERKFLVAILADDEKKREELKMVLEQLDAQDFKIRRRLQEIRDDEDDELKEISPKKKVFRADIKENMMANALCEVYEKTLGDNEEAKSKHYDFKPIDLIAYLYIMVDIYNYGRYDFHKNGKRPFFEFFITKVRPELGVTRGITRETMGNRIRKDFDCLYLSDEDKAKKPTGLQKQYESVKKDFQTICGIFHKTRLGTILKRYT